MRQLRRWKRLWRRSLTCSHKDFHGAFQKLLERYSKCSAAGGYYFKGVSFVLSIKVPTQKKSGNLFNDPRRKLTKSLSAIHITIVKDHHHPNFYREMSPTSSHLDKPKFRIHLCFFLSLCVLYSFKQNQLVYRPLFGSNHNVGQEILFSQ